MFKPQINTTQWLMVKKETREQIARDLNLSKRGGCIVEDGRVLSDGYTHDDLSGITVEKLQEATGIMGDDLFELFGFLVDKIENPKEPTIIPEIFEPIITTEQLSERKEEPIDLTYLQDIKTEEKKDEVEEQKLGAIKKSKTKK